MKTTKTRGKVKSCKWKARRKVCMGFSRKSLRIIRQINKSRYVCGKNHVWVEAETFDPDGISIEYPKKVKKKLANPEKIIKCICGLPAKRIDQYWPYHDEMNRCAGCMEKEKWIKL